MSYSTEICFKGAILDLLSNKKNGLPISSEMA